MRKFYTNLAGDAAPDTPRAPAEADNHPRLQPVLRSPKDKGEDFPYMTVESEKDLAGLRRVGRVVGLALREMRENLEPGMTTGELDGVGARVFERFGARSAPQLVYGFPGVNCISVNDEAVHGLPGRPGPRTEGSGQDRRDSGAGRLHRRRGTHRGLNAGAAAE